MHAIITGCQVSGILNFLMDIDEDDEAIDMLSLPDSDGVEDGWGLNELEGLKGLTGLRGPGEPNGERAKRFTVGGCWDCWVMICKRSDN